jgi:hypothetical protein
VGWESAATAALLTLAPFALLAVLVACSLLGRSTHGA